MKPLTERMADAMEPTETEFYEGMYESIYTALFLEKMPENVAHFFAQLAVDVERLKRHEL